MSNSKKAIVSVFVLALVLSSGDAAAKNSAKAGRREVETTQIRVVLWRGSADLSSRNLYYGPGGQRRQPHGKFTFVKEDRGGSNPKFVVRDDNGAKWKVKLGPEARAETAASRIVWGAGFFTDEDYLVPDLRVEELPARLHRGEKLRGPAGTFQDARLEREDEDGKKIGVWLWDENPFVASRELAAFRVLMSVINNWDLKDVNNAVIERTHAGSGLAEHVYLITDLGATFGATRLGHYQEESKGNLESYRRSVFIRRLTPEYVDFESPGRPAAVALVNPPQFLRRLELRWLGRNISRADARWTGELLARLSHEQIRDAFRAAHYSDAEVDGFTQVFEERIQELIRL